LVVSRPVSVKKLQRQEDTDIHGVQVGTVEGFIKALYRDYVILTLKPTRITGLLSIKSFANSRNITEAQLRTTITVGKTVSNLSVLSKFSLTSKTVKIGNVVSGRVTSYARAGTRLHIARGLRGILHPMDT
jgi:rRNA biogenesis protein RRP5